MELYSFDIETTGLDMTRDQLLGIALTKDEDFDSCIYYDNMEDMEACVRWMTESQVPLLAWNAFFDVTRLLWFFPWAKFNVVADGAVLAQMIDNSDTTVGFGLKACVGKYLGRGSYTDELIDWLTMKKDSIGIEGTITEENFRKYLSHAPAHMVETYCKEDAVRTLQFWNWGQDRAKGSVEMWMELFCAELRGQVQAYMAGMRADVDGLQQSVKEYEDRIAKADEVFYGNEELKKYFHYTNLFKRQEDVLNRFVKSKTGKVKPKDLEEFAEKNPFNTNSPKDKKIFFGMQDLFWDWEYSTWEYPAVTEKGAPKFDKDNIGYYGVGGEILDTIGNSRSMLTRAKLILKEIGSDGRYRCDVNLVGTKSGRVSSDGSNILAMPFDEALVTKNIIPDEGNVFVTVDFVSLEPSIQAHLSGDNDLRYAVYDGEGKRPFWKDGKLFIDDIYLMTVSSVDKFKHMLDIDLDGWLVDKDKEKAKNKKLRKAFKAVYLMITYGASIDKVRANLMQLLGITLSTSEAAKIVMGVWKAYPLLLLMRNKLRSEVTKNGFFVNELGYPLHFREFGQMSVNNRMLHKTINRMVQSTAAAVMRVFQYNLEQVLPEWMVPVVPNLHDASLHQVPVDKIKQAEEVYMRALDETNKDLEWGFPLRLSFTSGRSMYELKQE